MEYELVSSISTYSLSSNVNELLKKGYTPKGEVIVTISHAGLAYYTQALIKEDRQHLIPPI